MNRKLRFVLICGFLLQFVWAFVFFRIGMAFNILHAVVPPYNMWLTLLLAFMLATPIGFLMANFIFYHIPEMRKKLDKISNYHKIQKILLWLLVMAILFTLFLLYFFIIPV